MGGPLGGSAIMPGGVRPGGPPSAPGVVRPEGVAISARRWSAGRSPSAPGGGPPGGGPPSAPGWSARRGSATAPEVVRRGGPPSAPEVVRPEGVRHQRPEVVRLEVRISARRWSAGWVAISARRWSARGVRHQRPEAGLPGGCHQRRRWSARRVRHQRPGGPPGGPPSAPGGGSAMSARRHPPRAGVVRLEGVRHQYQGGVPIRRGPPSAPG